MEEFKKAALELLKFNSNAWFAYDNARKQANYGLFEGTRWIWFVVACIAAIAYNGWKWLGTVIAQAEGTSPKINIFFAIVIVISFVFTIAEKIDVLKQKNMGKKKMSKLIKEREKLMLACDQAAEKCRTEMYPWWRNFDVFNYKQKSFGDVTLAYCPKEVIGTDENGEYIEELFTGEEAVSGSVLLGHIKRSSGKTYYLFSEMPDPFKTYYEATLVNVDIESAEHTIQEWIADENADEKVRQYEEELDDDERWRNKSEHGVLATNEEMNKDYIYRAADEEKRRKRVELYKSLLGHYEEKVMNKGLWNHTIDTQAKIYMDSELNKIIGIRVEDDGISKHYLMTASRVMGGKECRIVKKGVYNKRCPELFATDPQKVLSHISQFPLGEMDFSVQKPENVPDAYWNIWLQAHFTEYDSVLYK